jgi:rRNA-processing protein FCF1
MKEKKDTITVEVKNEEDNLPGNIINIPLHSKYQLKEILLEFIDNDVSSIVISYLYNISYHLDEFLTKELKLIVLKYLEKDPFENLIKYGNAINFLLIADGSYVLRYNR